MVFQIYVYKADMLENVFMVLSICKILKNIDKQMFEVFCLTMLSMIY